MYITQITRLQEGDNQGEGTISFRGNTTKNFLKFAWNHLVMFTCISHKSHPWRTGTKKVKGLYAEAGYYHKTSKIHVKQTSEVSIYITQITPLEDGDYKGEGTINWSGNTSIKIQNFAWNQGVRFPICFHVYDTNHPLGRRVLRRWRDSTWSGMLPQKLKKKCVDPWSQVSMHITQITPLETVDYEREWTIRWSGNTTTKIQKLAWNLRVRFQCISHKSPPREMGLRR